MNEEYGNRMNQATTFHARAAKIIEQVLATNGIAADLEEQGNARSLEFDWQGNRYTIAIFADEINMREGKNLYECYLREEFESDDTYIHAFCARLSRFLRDGEWKAPQEDR